MKKLIVFTLCMFLTFAAAQYAYAYELLGGKHKTNNITYTTRDFNGTYEKIGQQLGNAIADWNATSTKITFSAHLGSTTIRPQIVIKSDDYGKTGWSGRATNYREWVTTGDYVDSVVQGNLYYLNNYGASTVKGVWAHELGHALGLDHVSGDNKLMYDNDGRTVYKPTSDEINGVNSLYK